MRADSRRVLPVFLLIIVHIGIGTGQCQSAIHLYLQDGFHAGGFCLVGIDVLLVAAAGFLLPQGNLVVEAVVIAGNREIHPAFGQLGRQSILMARLGLQVRIPIEHHDAKPAHVILLIQFLERR